MILTGVLAACWPCGVVAHLDELFISESLAQVYGSLHSLLRINQSQTATISEDYHLNIHSNNLKTGSCRICML